MSNTYSTPGLPAETDDNLKNIVLDLDDFTERDTTLDQRTRRGTSDYGLSAGSTLAQEILLSTFTAPNRNRQDAGWQSTFGVNVTDSDSNVTLFPAAVVVKTTVVISGLVIAELTPGFVCNMIRAHQRLPWGTPSSGSPNLDFMTQLLRGYSRVK